MQSLIYYNEPEGSKFDWRKLLHVNLFNATEGKYAAALLDVK